MSQSNECRSFWCITRRATLAVRHVENVSVSLLGASRRSASLISLFALMVCCGLFSVGLGADTMWDLKNYHVYNAFAAWHDRYLFDVAPAQMQSYLNPILDYPFVFAITAFNDHPRTIAFLMGLPQGINLWLIGLIASRCLAASERRPLALDMALLTLAVFVGATGAGAGPLIGSTTGDLFVTLPILGGLWALLRGIDSAENSHATGMLSLLLAGLFMGFAVGAKPTAACYAVAGSAALLLLPSRFIVGGLARYVLAGGIGAVVTGGYHAWRMVHDFRNPFFPLMNNIFRSAFWEEAPLRDSRFLPKSTREAVFYPFEWAIGGPHSIVSELAFRDIRIALMMSLLVILAIAAAIPSIRSRAPLMPRSAAAFLVFAIVSYVLWLVLFSIYRYLIPLELLSGALIVVALSALVRKPTAVVGAAVAAAACWLTTTPLDWGHTPFRSHYIEVAAPKVAPDALVLIIGMDPVGYFVPFVAPDARWLSLANNFLRPEQANLLVKREHALVAAHKGPILALNAGATPEVFGTTLAAYGLAREPKSCRKVSSNLGGESYDICKALAAK